MIKLSQEQKAYILQKTDQYKEELTDNEFMKLCIAGEISAISSQRRKIKALLDNVLETCERNMTEYMLPDLQEL